MIGIFGILESSATQWYQDVNTIQDFFFHRHIYSLRCLPPFKSLADLEYHFVGSVWVTVTITKLFLNEDRELLHVNFCPS
jgi:hypothetical protein